MCRFVLKKSSSILLFLLITKGFVSCTTNANNDYSKYVKQLDSLSQKENITEIKRLHKIARDNKNSRLREIAELYLIKDNKDSTIDIKEEITKKVESYPAGSPLKAQALMISSFIFWDKGMQQKGVEDRLNAYNIYSSLSSEEFPLKRVALDNLGGGFYYYQDYATALKYFLEALKEPPAYIGQSPGDFSILNVVALCYRATGKYDSATIYFKSALQKAIEAGNEAWIGIIKGNMGINYYLQRKYEEAIPFLKEDIERSIKLFGVADPYSLTVLGNVYFKQNKLDSALYNLEKAYNFLKKEPEHPNYKVIAELYPTLAAIYLIKADNRARDLYDKALSAKDSIAKQRNSLIAAGALHKTESEKHFVEISLLKQQKQTQQYIRKTLIIIIILVSVIAVILIIFQKARHTYKLQAASMKLEAFTQAIHEKNNLIDKFSEELNLVREETEKSSLQNEKHDTIAELQQLTILTEEEWENFRLLFEKVHKGFLYRLKEKLPGLSPADVRFIALTKLNLANKEIAGMLGIGLSAVRTAKTRLKKKLSLNEDENIEDIIKKI